MSLYMTTTGSNRLPDAAIGFRNIIVFRGIRIKDDSFM